MILGLIIKNSIETTNIKTNNNNNNKLIVINNELDNNNNKLPTNKKLNPNHPNLIKY
jgi:hypothetical protein